MHCLRILTGFVLFLFLLISYSIHSISSRDPTSLFFNPKFGYAPRYSTLRREQAEQYVAAVSAGTQKLDPIPNNENKRLCIGIPSVARKGAQYLHGAVGSLLEGLTPEERSDIHLIVFIPHSDPTRHPVFHEAWLPVLADEVLTYKVSGDQMKHIKEMEVEAGMYREKGVYDYTYLVRTCAQQGTPYIAMMEDDTVAMDGWYHRTIAAIEKAETLSALKKAKPEFLYLRLFYTEEFLGWNSEEWRTYLFYSIIVAALPIAGLVGARSASPTAKRYVTNRALLFTLPISAILIGLFFALGRVTVLPMSPGVHYMPKFGCCSQAFVFPRHKAVGLSHYLEERKIGFVDVMTEEYADQRGELRWAVSPSLVQHVGRKSSKIDDYGEGSKWGLSVAEKIWSFGFERLDALRLRREHERAVQGRG